MSSLGLLIFSKLKQKFKPLAYMFTGTSICRLLFPCKQNVRLDLFQTVKSNGTILSNVLQNVASSF